MDELYGKEVADKVYARLEQIDPEFNELVQRVAYDMFWGRTGLGIAEKSLATVTALVALERAEQTHIHLNGLINCGWSVTRISGALNHLSATLGERAVVRARAALDKVVAEHKLASPPLNVPLTAREKHVVALASCAAGSDTQALASAMREFLSDGGSRDDVRHLMIHLAVYCGFPAAMTALAILSEL